MSTVHDAIKKEAVVADVVLNFRTPVNTNKIMAIVEGDDDIKLYSKLFNNQTVYFHTLIVKGCEYFEDVLVECNPKYERNYFVIKDADFDCLNNQTYPYPNLFLTDTHDIETLILKDDSLNSICCEYLLPGGAFTSLNIMSDIKVLSYFKWYNNIHQLGINFDAPGFFNLYDGSNAIGIDDCLRWVYNAPANQGRNVITSDVIMDFIANNNAVDVLQLMNGHDVCDGIRAKIGYLKSNRNIVGNKEDIPRCLRIKYSFADFMQTTLYSKINSWATTIGYNLF